MATSRFLLRIWSVKEARSSALTERPPRLGQPGDELKRDRSATSRFAKANLPR